MLNPIVGVMVRYGQYFFDGHELLSTCVNPKISPEVSYTYRLPIAFLLGAGGVEGLETPRLWQASGLSERQRAEILGCKADGWDNNGLISTFWDDNI